MAIWLLAGVAMIVVQTSLGGITRLTGSGLSITQWDPIIGAIPPLNHHEWMVAFDKYRQTPQFRLKNPDFNLGEFKSIFFWEYIHRLWGRLIGVVFAIPFLIFLVQKRFSRNMVQPMILLFLLGGLQGLIGWIMVESGLTGDNISVNPLNLATHFMTALVLLYYTLWFALKLLVKEQERIHSPSLKGLSLTILVLLAVQLTYGAFMAGLHAELYAPTWPDIKGAVVPAHLFSNASAWVNDPLTVQFIHRGLAYLIILEIIIWFIRSRHTGSPVLSVIRFLPLSLVLLQVLLGILTILGSRIRIPVGLAVSHQFVALLLLISMTCIYFMVGGRSRGPAAGKWARFAKARD